MLWHYAKRHPQQQCSIRRYGPAPSAIRILRHGGMRSALFAAGKLAVLPAEREVFKKTYFQPRGYQTRLTVPVVHIDIIIDSIRLDSGYE